MVTKAKNNLLQGTLDMLVLKALSLGTMHGYGVRQRIQQTSDDVLNRGRVWITQRVIWKAAPNNGMHPSRIARLSSLAWMDSRMSARRVMPGVGRLSIDFKR